VSAPPKTILQASAAEATSIRHAVRTADPGSLGPGNLLATQAHVPGLVDLLSDPAVSDWIYSLPRPLTLKSVSAWVADAATSRAAGEAILVVSTDAAGAIGGYARFTIWPERASGELGGASRASLQNAGHGRAAAWRRFDWMFSVLGLRLVGVTTALDNVRSARVIEAAGFVSMGEVISRRPDGSGRASLAWEMTREIWQAKRAVLS
jgi:RimJ/RimL family protein N-acetyltransferase